MSTIATNDGLYSGLPNKLVGAASGIGYAYRDNWDPALIDALA
jgi:hypothetical protein